MRKQTRNHKDLLYVSGLFMPSSGGAEISMYTILKHLADDGYRIVVITGENDTGQYFDDTSDGSFVIRRIANAGELVPLIPHVLADFPDIIALITQNLWSDRAILAAKRHRLPVIYFLRSPFGNLDLTPGSPYACEFVLANSPATKEYLETKYALRDVPVIPPVINYAAYLTPHNTRRFITMVNPIEIKGGGLFKEIARRLPGREFLAVLGWGHLKKNHQWSMARLTELAECYRAEVYVPQETDFSEAPNVVVHPTVSDMRLIYGQTRLLLIPSVKSEAAPRVGFEAMINGIPVIGSAVGGIPYVIGQGGLVIDDYYDIDAWAGAIERFDDASFYKAYSLLARERARAEDAPSNIKPLRDILETLSHRVRL